MRVYRKKIKGRKLIVIEVNESEAKLMKHFYCFGRTVPDGCMARNELPQIAVTLFDSLCALGVSTP